LLANIIGVAATLEKASAETATLRHLANAASLIEGNLTILQLRLLPFVQDSSGNTLVLGMPSQSTLLPVREQQADHGSNLIEQSGGQ
jgi:hypothetical protein